MPFEPHVTSPPATVYMMKISTLFLLYSTFDQQMVCAVDLPAKSLISALGRDAYVNWSMTEIKFFLCENNSKTLQLSVRLYSTPGSVQKNTKNQILRYTEWATIGYPESIRLLASFTYMYAQLKQLIRGLQQSSLLVTASHLHEEAIQLSRICITKRAYS